MKHFLTVHGISKSFGKTNVLANCSFTAEKGELISLLGESGSGKTTLLRIIAGFEHPDKGEVQMNGRLLCNANYAMMPEHRYVGLVFQDYALFPHLSVNKNIELGKKSELSAAHFLNLVGLNEFGKRKPHELSGGQQQRVAIARSLAAQPQLLLLDEPFSNIDESLKFNFRRELRELLKNQEIPSIFVTHDTKDALAIADKIIILKDGDVRQIGTPEDIYLRPADIYVAGLLGTFNTVSEDNQQAAIIRSEHTRIVTGSDYEVTSAMYQGRSYLIHLEKGHTQCSVSSEQPLAVGSKVGLEFPNEFILHVLKK